MQAAPDPAKVAALQRILHSQGGVGLRQLDRALAIPDPWRRYAFMAKAAAEFRRIHRDASKYFEPPVDIETFITSPRYMDAGAKGDKGGTIWPRVMDALKEMNSGSYTEALLTGGIGTAKTTVALYTQAYQAYRLLLLRDPHAEFDLDPSSEIVMVLQSLRFSTAKTVDYARLRAMIERAPWFRDNAPFDHHVESLLKFPRRFIIQPVSGQETAAIGENVIGGLIDEMNFMAVTSDSKKSGDGEAYDQAQQNYNAIARRRESRFMVRGELPGLLCLISSSRYPGQFTDRKKDEARENPHIYVYDKRLWDVRPEKFGDARFSVFVGDGATRPRILARGEQPPGDQEDLVMEVPEEYRRQFELDVYGALRDIGGVSTQGIHPWLPRPDLIANCFSTSVRSAFSAPSVDFVTDQLAILPKAIERPMEPRWAHVDLAITGDSAGVVVGHVEKFLRIERSKGEWEALPVIRIDGILEVRPPPGGEIIFAKVRALLYRLRELGVNMKWVSYDSFQSRDSIQVLRQRGLIAGELSMDRDTRPYDVTKQAVYDARIVAPEHERCRIEMTRLQFNALKAKVDHPPRGSKDCADALAGVVYGLTTRREIWIRHGIPPREIPAGMIEKAARVRASREGEGDV